MKIIANLIMCLHFFYVLCVAVPILLILIGAFRKWNYVRNFWFRLVHFSLIGIVIALSVLGYPCPLTVWEDHYRQLGGESSYYHDFMTHWISTLLYYDFEPWQCTIFYIAVGVFLLSLFYLVPPHSPLRKPRIPSK
ncbi:MAG: DUF2784 domain-containing protein [Candidatus Omnitrophota bacterium]